MFFIIANQFGLSYDFKLSSQESFLQDHLLNLHILIIWIGYVLHVYVNGL